MPAAKVAPEGSRNDTGWFTRLLRRRWGVPAGDERQHRAPLARFGARDLGAGVVIAHALVVLRVGRVPERASRGAAGHAQVAVERGLAVAVQLLERMLLEAVELHEKGKHLRAVWSQHRRDTHELPRAVWQVLLVAATAAVCTVSGTPGPGEGAESPSPAGSLHAGRDIGAATRNSSGHHAGARRAISWSRSRISSPAARSSFSPLCCVLFRLSFLFVFAGAESPSASIFHPCGGWRPWRPVSVCIVCVYVVCVCVCVCVRACVRMKAVWCKPSVVAPAPGARAWCACRDRVLTPCLSSPAARWTAGSAAEARVEAGGDTSMNDALSRNETATPPSGSSDAGRRRYAHAPPPRRHSAPSAGSLVPVPDAPWDTDVRAC